MKPFLPLLITAILIGCQTQKKETQSSAFLDFENDPDAPAQNRELLIPILGDTVAGYAFIANGKEPKETVILAHGFPGNDNQFDLAQSIRRAGKNVIHFNYRGTWGSQGELLYSNELEDLDEIIKYLCLPEISERLRVKTEGFTILGRSYGGGLALIAGSQNEKVNRIISISGTNYGAIVGPYDHTDSIEFFRPYMQRQVMINVDIDAFLQDMIDNKEQFNVVTYKEDLSKKEVLIIEDSDRNLSWINKLEGVKLVKVPSDHGFVNRRIQMIETVVQWLNGEPIE